VVVVLQEVVEGVEGIGMADGRGIVVLGVQGRGNAEVVQIDGTMIERTTGATTTEEIEEMIPEGVIEMIMTVMTRGIKIGINERTTTVKTVPVSLSQDQRRSVL